MYRRNEIDDLLNKLVQVKGGCLIFTGATNDKGYGLFRYNDKNDRAHRVSYIMHKGPIPEDKQVLHTCDNPPCCNPDHLFIGTARDNTHDMIAKGRDRFKQCGEVNGASKLTKIKVEEIREKLSEGFGLRHLGRVYGVDKNTIARIRDGEVWL